jgi:hypothetical protein
LPSQRFGKPREFAWAGIGKNQEIFNLGELITKSINVRLFHYNPPSKVEEILT